MAVECDHKMDRDLKYQFINSLSDDGMIVEVIHEQTAISDMNSVISEQVLAQERRIEVQTAQTATLDCLEESEGFDVVQSKNTVNKAKDKCQESQATDHDSSRNASIVDPATDLKICPPYEKMCWGCRKLSHIWVVCSSAKGRRGAVHNIEKSTMTDKQVDMVNITSLTLNRTRSVITAMVWTSS